jgi:competence protein ComEC
VWGGLALRLTAVAGDNPSDLALHFLDVGQGDGAVIRTPGGHWVVIDAGPKTDRFDAGRRIVAPFLLRHGVTRLSALIVSHAHADHLGGVEAVLDRVPADLVMDPGELLSDSLYLGFLDHLAAFHIPWEVGRPGQRFVIDSVTFTVLHPDTSWVEWGEDLNEDSIVLLLQYRNFRALFPGDAGFRAEARLRGKVGRLNLLKVGHHGSCTASGDEWLTELRPTAVVVSVGAVNRYGHPCPATLSRLASHGASIWRTDREGDVTVETDGTTMTVQAKRGTERFRVRSEE